MTKYDYYCELSWRIFEALDAHTKLKVGYAAIEDIFEERIRHRDVMPSYFIAETLKYAYLCAARKDVTSTYVLNTEAHLFPKTRAMSSTAPAPS